MPGGKSHEKTEYCVRLLRQRAEELGRLPMKSDMETESVVLIKACLGPWPRALEAAGLKPVSPRLLGRNLREKAREKLRSPRQ